jgi:hypothetical protein
LFHDLGEVQIDSRKKVQTDTRKKASAAAVALKSHQKCEHNLQKSSRSATVCLTITGGIEREREREQPS